MANSWQEYQEEAAAFFRTLGLGAETDVKVTGVRTDHMVDVVVRSRHAGFDVLWLVECKHWQTRVSKLHVLALREIVADVGADRGILLSETGFQLGATEAATLTNVRTTSLAALRTTTTMDIQAMRLRDLYDRNDACKDRYWEIPKEDRIRRGLRPDVGVFGFSGARTVELVDEVLVKAFRGTYPFECDSFRAVVEFDGLRQFESPSEVIAVIEPMIADHEARLNLLDSEG